MGSDDRTRTDETRNDGTPNDEARNDESRSDWTPNGEAVVMIDRYEFDDLDLMVELTHPIRGVILRRLKDPLTVAELAELMDVPVTRLYHHVNRLSDIGLIQVVATRQVAAVTERRYQVVAKTFAIDRRLFDTLDNRELSVALGSVFDVAKLGFQRVVDRGGYRGIGSLEEHSLLSLGEINLSRGRRHELMRRLRGVIAEFESDLPAGHPESTSITLFVAAYPEAH